MADVRIPANLKALRKARKMKQAEVADAIGVAQQTYSHYEMGDRTPGPDVLIKLANLFEVGIEELYYIDAESPENAPSAYDSQPLSSAVRETSKYVHYVNQPENSKKISQLDRYERELIYLFGLLEDTDDRREVIEFVRFKSNRRKF